MRRKTERRDNSRLLRVVAAVVLIATLYFARVVFIPLALAFLVSLLLTPVVAFLERMKFPRIIAISLVVIAVAGAMGATGWVISQQIVSLTDQLPTYIENSGRKDSRPRKRTQQGRQSGLRDLARLGERDCHDGSWRKTTK